MSKGQPASRPLAAHDPPLALDSAIDWPALEAESTQLLSRYLQFDTTNPPGNEAAAVEFLADLLRERGFAPQVIESAPDRANLIVRLPGSSQAAPPACLLYTHADVVPAQATDWSSPPFAGEIREGFVWGRGALDDKGLGIIFIQALTLLKQFSPPKRDLILLIAADEESCGQYGVAWLMDHHPDLIRAEYVWDEGGMGWRQRMNPDRYLYAIALAEKGALTVKLVAHGTPGHASIPHPDNPQDRLVRALTRIKQWEPPARLSETVLEMLRTLAPSQPFPRSTLFAHAGHPFVWSLLRPILATDPLFSPLIRHTVSLTMLRGGQKSNIIPAQAEAKLDIRLLPGESVETVLAELRSLIADPKVEVQAEDTPIPHPPTPSATEFYQALAETLGAIGPPGLVIPYLTPGATDSRFFRRAGMKAYGFMPLLLDNRELSRVHGIDERISTANLRWGIQVVFETLRRF